MSKIEWTDETWNPVVGCSKVSSGCANCYAVNFAHRHANNPVTGETYHGLTVKHPNGIVDWSGKVKCLPERLEIPLKWKKPRHIFVNSMSDWLHGGISDTEIFQILAICAITPQHTYQFLTKRPERLPSLLSDLAYASEAIGIWAEYYSGLDRFIWHKDDSGNADQRWTWPFPNVQLGTSVEDQKTADERIPHLLSCHSGVHFISAEPLLGPIELRYDFLPRMESLGNTLDWVIVGGESGPKARPMNPEWVRSLRDQCADAGVPFFFKQWGEYDENGNRVGKSRAGRTLDGRTHDEYPDGK